MESHIFGWRAQYAGGEWWREVGIEIEVEVEAFVDFESKSFAMVTMLYVLLTLGDVAS